MAFQVIYPDQGNASGKGNGLGCRQPGAERPDQSRAPRYGDTLDLGQGEPGIPQRLYYNRGDGLDMFAGGNLRDDTAVLCMNINLGSDDVGQHHPPVANDGGSGFVTRRFYA